MTKPINENNEDRLGLNDRNIPLAKRYEEFLKAYNESPSKSSTVLAFRLGVEPPIVDIFLNMGILDENEIKEYDRLNFDLGMVFFITKYDESNRATIMKEYPKYKNEKEPILKLKRYLDKQLFGATDDMLNDIEPRYWGQVAHYLKARNIERGTINRKFRSLLVRAAKDYTKLSQAQKDWISRAMLYDFNNKLNCFKNDYLEAKFPNSCQIVEEYYNNHKNI